MDSLSGTFAFIELEDVLAKPDRTPIPLGIMVTRALKNAYRLALSTTFSDEDKIRYWLGVNGFPGDFFTYILGREVTDPQDEDDMFSLHLDRVRSDAVVELVLTASPARAARAMHRGVAALMLGNPVTARPDFRPGRNVKPWAEIEEAVSQSLVQKVEAE